MSESLKTKIEIVVAAIVAIACFVVMAQLPDQGSTERCDRNDYCETVNKILD